ncbi:MAG: hypothetical protein IJP68_07560 [Selenomonadaceae bacterium]|nr:hypothetical protein [Selenomonadaceae bacterium]
MPINQLTAENISEVTELFKAATARAKAAGYYGIQLHAAYGFFLSQYIYCDVKILHFARRRSLRQRGLLQKFCACREKCLARFADNPRRRAQEL